MTDVVIHVLHGHEVLPLWAGVGRHFARGVSGSRRTGLRLSLCACLLAGWRTGDGTGREPLVPPDHLDLPPPLLGRPGLTRAAGAACMMPACRGRLHQLRPVPACYLCAGGPQQLQHHVSSRAPASADAEVPAPWLPPGSQPPEGQGGESDGWPLPWWVMEDHWAAGGRARVFSLPSMVEWLCGGAAGPAPLQGPCHRPASARRSGQ